MADPTIQELQQQLVTIRERLREVEGIAFRPIHVTVNFPGWPHPLRWTRSWLADRRANRDQRLVARHRAKALRAWRRLCRRAQCDPRSVTSAQLDLAWAAYTGKDGWKPPRPWLVRLQAWWAERKERAAIARLRRLMASAKPEDVEAERLRSLKKIERRIARARPNWWSESRGALLMGKRAIEWAGKRQP